MQFKLFEIIFFLHVFDDLLSVTQLQATKLDIGSCRRVLDGVERTMILRKFSMLRLILRMKINQFTIHWKQAYGSCLDCVE